MENIGRDDQKTATPRRRGRPNQKDGPALDRQALIEKLLSLAQAEGVETLNMRRVAASLGVSTRLLYHYVQDKDEMLELLSEAILARNPPDLSSPDWQTRLRIIARTNYDNLRQYPGLPAAILARTLRRTQLPHTAALRQAIFQALDDAGLQRAQAEEAFILFSLITLGSLTMTEHWDGSEDLEIERAMVERSLLMGVELVLFGIRRLIERN